MKKLENALPDFLRKIVVLKIMNIGLGPSVSSKSNSRTDCQFADGTCPNCWTILQAYLILISTDCNRYSHV